MLNTPRSATALGLIEAKLRIVVFDFDGTLVDSNQIKYNAYFSLFPVDERHRQVVKAVLAEKFETTRFINLRHILERLGETENLDTLIRTLANRYNDIVLTEVKYCSEKPGATEVLAQLSDSYALYLSSTTPEGALRDIIEHRGWTKWFRGIFGYPAKKCETIQTILATERAMPNEAVIVGDGESDSMAAAVIGCYFYYADGRHLAELLAELLTPVATAPPLIL